MKTIDSNGFSDYIQHFEKNMFDTDVFKKTEKNTSQFISSGKHNIDIKMSAIRIF